MTEVNHRASFRHRLVAKAMLHSRMRNWAARPTQVDQWSTRPRRAYAGLPPGRVRRKIDVARTDLEGWPVYEIGPKLPESVALNGHVLYLHGGYYVIDFAPQFHWPMVATLAVTLRRTVTVPIYPLAPEHTYRDVYPFLLNVYRRVLDTHDPQSVVFLGESAGGGLALGLCHAVRAAGLPQPRDAVLLSPWLHAGLPEVDSKIDPILNLDLAKKAASYYAGGDALDNPLVSPGIGSLEGLPKITVLTGTNDLLNLDARAFRRRANAQGVDIGWYELDGGMHGWMALPVGRDVRDAWDYVAQTLR